MWMLASAQSAWAHLARLTSLQLPPASPPPCAWHLSPQEHLPADKLEQVKGVLFGLNCGKPVAAVPLPAELSSAAAAGGYDLQVCGEGWVWQQIQS